MSNEKVRNNIIEQGIGANIQFQNELRYLDLIQNLNKIIDNQSRQINKINIQGESALKFLNKTSKDIKSLIESNRGSEKGVHGFIAEFAETGIANAKLAVRGAKKSTVLLDNNGQADLIVDGNLVQVKFYKNIIREIKTSSRYRNLKMMFPKEHVDIYRKIMTGEKDIIYNGRKLTPYTIDKIKEQITLESKLRGESWEEFLVPSKLDYDDVQIENINKIINKEKKSIKEISEKRKQNQNLKTEKEKLQQINSHKPSISGAAKAGAVGAALQGGLSFAISIMQKLSDGKNICEFTKEDWLDCGVISSIEAIKGGISGATIYGLTNACKMSAPSASAIASGTLGLIDAANKLRTKQINDEEFATLATVNAIDATGVAIGAALGQAVIPIPVLGAVIGSITTGIVLNIGKDILIEHEQNIIKNYEQKLHASVKNLDEKYNLILNDILGAYNDFKQLQDFAFNLEINIDLKLSMSILLAKQSGVEETEILHNLSEIDKYFLD